MKLKITVLRGITLISLCLAAAGLLAAYLVHNVNERLEANHRRTIRFEAEKKLYDALVTKTHNLKSSIDDACQTIEAKCRNHINETVDALTDEYPPEYVPLLKSITDTQHPFDPANFPRDLAEDFYFQQFLEDASKAHKAFALFKSEHLELDAKLDNFIEKIMAEESMFTPREDKRIDDMHCNYLIRLKEYEDDLIHSTRQFFDRRQNKTIDRVTRATRSGNRALNHYAEKKFIDDYMMSIDKTTEPISKLKDEFVQANASTNEGAATSAAIRYLRKAYGKDIIVCEPKKQVGGCWLFSFIHHDMQPIIPVNAILFPDGNYESCHWESLTRFVKSEYANPLSDDDIEQVFCIIEKEKKVGKTISSENAIPDYYMHPMTQEQLESLKTLPTHPNFVSRLYYNRLGGNVLRITILLSPTNTLEQIAGKFIANGIGDPYYLE